MRIMETIDYLTDIFSDVPHLVLMVGKRLMVLEQIYEGSCRFDGALLGNDTTATSRKKNPFSPYSSEIHLHELNKYN